MFYSKGPISAKDINAYTQEHPESSAYLRTLHQNNFLEVTPLVKNHIVVGSKDEIRITDKGIKAFTIYKEEHRWFNMRFVLLQIVLPIVIAIITTLITVFLTAKLGQYQ